jgi:hypothetical protein
VQLTEPAGLTPGAGGDYLNGYRVEYIHLQEIPQQPLPTQQQSPSTGVVEIADTTGDDINHKNSKGTEDSHHR